MEYVLLYALIVIWIAAGLLYADGFMVHSKREVILAPLLIVLSAVQWGVRFFDSRLSSSRYR